MVRTACSFRLVIGIGALVVACSVFAGEKWLDEFDLSTMSCGVGKRPQVNKSCLGNPLRMGAGVYRRGVGTHGESVFVLQSNGKTTAFDAVVGLDKDAETQNFWAARKGWAQVRFRVYADGRLVAESPLVKEGTDPVPFHVDLSGKRMIVLEASHGGHWASSPLAFADWADAKFTLADGGMLVPHPDANLTRQLGILTPPERPEPRINGAEVWGVRPGHPILWRVPVSGVRPMKLSAEGLPPGATFDAEKGMLGGAVDVPGDYAITFHAENARGRTSRRFTLRVGEKICLTPPLGWNSWNSYGSGITDAIVREQARGMHESGLADHGWNYLNIDDWWMKNKGARGKGKPEHDGPARDAAGRFIPQAKFPDMKALCDFVHSYGLKIGIYSSPGDTTCGGCEGSLGHEMTDAQTWAEWGIDYLKHDWCGYGKVFGSETKGRKPTADDYAKPYRLMSKCLRAQNRDIVHAFCQYGMGDVQSWGEEAGAQVWRSWGDLKDAWPCINNAIDAYAGAYKATRPGFWCDPDMMVVGYLSTDQGMHESYLTPNEQYTHVSLWALLNAPMLLGCNLTKISPFTRNLLMNDEILALSQDTMGRQAGCIYKDEGSSVWWRPLANGDSAAGLVNRYPFTRKITFRFSDAGLVGTFDLRDCWRQQDLGAFTGSWTCEVPPHATAVVRLSRPATRSPFGPLSPSAQVWDREYIWPDGKMPDAQPHQIAAKSDDVAAPGFEPDVWRRPYIEWYMPEASVKTDLCMLFVSGGGFNTCCDALRLQPAIDRFVKAGVTVANLTYRTPRAKESPIHQTAWEDVQRAVRVIRSQAAKRGFKPEKIGATGISAGAKAVLLVATSSETRAYAPVDDIDRLPCNLLFAVPQAPAYVLTDGATGANSRDGDAIDVTIVPELKFDARTCPMCFIQGGADRISPNGSTQIYRQLRRMKIPAELHLFADREHGFHGDMNKGDDATAYDHWFGRVMEFIRQMNYDGRRGAEVDLMARFPDDAARGAYVRQDIWPAGRTPSVQTNQCAPCLEWHFPKVLKTKAIQIIYSGGSYMRNGPDGFEVAPARRYLNEKGMTVVTMRYRTPRPLGGLAKHTTAWQDLQRAIRLVRKGAAERGLDPDRIGIMGSSAGGHLTLMGATSSKHRAYWPVDDIDRLSCSVQWAVAVYPAYALTDGAERPNVKGGNEDDSRPAPEFSFDLATCPIVFIHGDADGWAAMNSVKTWEQLRRMGIQGDLHTLATRGHCFQRKAAPGTGSYTWLDRIWEFMNHKGFNR